MVDDSAGKSLSKVPLSNHKTSRRVKYTVEDLSGQIIEKIKWGEYGLQSDEAIDINELILIILSWRMVWFELNVLEFSDVTRCTSGCYRGLHI